MYGKTIKTESGTYSIDKLTFEFWLDLNQDQLEAMLDLTGFKYTSERYGNFKSWPKRFLSGWTCKYYAFSPKDVEGSIVVQLMKRVNFIQVTPTYDDEGEQLTNGAAVPTDQFGIRVQLNPNKHLSDKFFVSLLSQLKDGFLKDYSWKLARVDYAFDVPLDFDDVCLLTQKTEGYYGDTTRYYGLRSHNGYTRLYDKSRKENIPGSLTRFEWEQHREQSLKFDIPLSFGLIPERLQWLRFIRLEQLNDCLKSLDKRTRKKVRENCFKPIPFDPDNFNLLLADYLFDFGLDERNHIKSGVEDLKRYEIEQSLLEADNDLEKLFYFRAPDPEASPESEVSAP